MVVLRTYDVTSSQNPDRIIDKMEAATKVLDLLSETANELKEHSRIDSIRIVHTILCLSRTIELVRSNKNEMTKGNQENKENEEKKENLQKLQNRENIINTAINSSSWEIKLG